MGAYKYVSELWRKKQSDVLRFLLRIRTWEYRHLPKVHRCSKPSRPDKARRLGYKAKPGFVVYRTRIRRGDRKKAVAKGIVYGKPVHQGVRKQKSTRSLRAMAEIRVARRVAGLEVLNSYWVGQDSGFKYYEVICVDPANPTIRNNPKINWICKARNQGRAHRGITSAGQKSRGLRNKGRSAARLRPSRRGCWKRRQLVSLRRYR